MGTVPLILALIGLTTHRNTDMARWRMLVLVSFALATMPAWWPTGYQLFLQLPGVGYFRAPGRYTVIASLGLALLAGASLDRTLTPRDFRIGLTLAAAFGVAAAGWAIVWSRWPAYAAALGPGDLRRFLFLAAITWAVSVAAILLWRAQKLGPAALFVLTAVELGILYYHGTTEWARSIDLPDRSPVLRRLAGETNVGTVAGYLDDLPVRAGQSPTYPYLGMRVPPPAGAMEFARYARATEDPVAVTFMRRMGVTHGVWNAPVSAAVEVLYQGPDEALDRLVYKPPGAPAHATWYLVRYLDVDPPVHVALHALDTPDLPTALMRVARDPSAGTAWFLPGERPPDAGPRARSARVLQWDGRSGVIEHDGDCDVDHPAHLRARLDGAPRRWSTRAGRAGQRRAAERAPLRIPSNAHRAAVSSTVLLRHRYDLAGLAARSGGGHRPGSVTS